MKDTQDYFTVGTRVNVTAHPGDMFTHDFTGIVKGHQWVGLVTVEDQDGECWDCEPGQLEFNTDEIMNG